MSELVEITNDGPAITRTSYWRTPHARRGLLYLSVNAGALRILVPTPTGHLLADLPAIGTPVELERSAYQDSETYRFLWLDDPRNPYAVEIDQRQCDRRLPRAEDGRILPLIWYTPVGVWGVVERRRESVQLERTVTS